MALWTHYNPDDFKDNSYSLLKVDDYRVRIDKVEETVTRKEPVRTMLKLTLAVSGHNSKLWYYIVLDDTNEEAINRTNQTLHKFFDCFGINNYSMNTNEWEGKIGGVRVKHREYQGSTHAEVDYLLYADKVKALPAWQEGRGGNINPNMINPATSGNSFNPSDIPF